MIDIRTQYWQNTSLKCYSTVEECCNILPLVFILFSTLSSVKKKAVLYSAAYPTTKYIVMHLINIQYTRLGLNEVGEHCRLGRAWADLSRKFHNESGNDERDWLDLLLTMASLS